MKEEKGMDDLWIWNEYGKILVIGEKFKLEFVVK